jgi:hypothetical protein
MIMNQEEEGQPPGPRVWKPDHRLYSTGHRFRTYYGLEPEQTRELHPVLWPFELAGRAEARIRGMLIRRRGTVNRRKRS